jgi:hypothetical protein
MERRPDSHFGEGPLKAEDEYDDEDEGRYSSLSWMRKPPLNLPLIRFARGRNGVRIPLCTSRDLKSGRHSRESGNPVSMRNLDSGFRRNDE